MATVRLRPAAPDDRDFAYRVHRAAMRDPVERIYGWDEEHQARYFDEHFNPTEQNIIRHNDTDVGVFSVEERKESLFLALIAVLPRYQRRGIGTTLVRRLQQEARERGLSVTLRVLRGNRAQALYERLGFVVTGETDTHHEMRWSAGAVVPASDPGSREDSRYGPPPQDA
jgi:GNAT superfamily N-acetyltransferase